MTKPVLREFRMQDVVEIVNRDGEQSASEIVAYQASAGPCFTAELDGVPIGCGGIVQQWPGVGICWMLLSKDIGNHGVWLTRVTKDFIARSVRVLKLHRLEATALVDSTRNQAWLELLGFTKEQDGVARGYLPNKKSMVRYERVGLEWHT